MDATTATDFITSNKGNDVELVLADGTHAFGTAISVNSRGVNIKSDGKVRSFGLARVTHMFLPTELDAMLADDDLENVPEDLAQELHDGMTTRDLADIMGTTPKELRVSLRALGMGVGKGRKYSLTPSAYIAVRNHLATA